MRPIATDGGTNRRAVVVGDDDGTIEVDGVMEAEDGDDGRGALIDIVAARRERRRVAGARAQLAPCLSKHKYDSIVRYRTIVSYLQRCLEKHRTDRARRSEPSLMS